jgi:hypothetical protein
MGKFLFSAFVILATIVTASASDRYPIKKRYVNQAGQVVTIGAATQIAVIAPLRKTAVQPLPAVQTVRAIEPGEDIEPARAAVAIDTRSSSRDSLFGAINADPRDWPSGRKCCAPGQAYFNEEPNS